MTLRFVQRQLLYLGISFAALELIAFPALAADTVREKSEKPSDDVQDLMEMLETPVEVYTATKAAETLQEAPAIIAVFNRDDIRAWGYDSLADLLRHVVGFYVIDDHIFPDVAVRGISGGLASESAVIKVMIDGHPVPFRTTSGNWLGSSFLPLSAIERIEIIRGPGSALYGADAFLGVINVVTRDPKLLQGADLGVETKGTTLSRLRGGTDSAIGARDDRFSILAAVRLESEDRSGLRLPASSPAPNVSQVANSSRTATNLILDSTVAFVRLGYQPNEKTTATISGHFSRIDRGAEFGQWTQLSYGLDNQGRKSETLVSLAKYSVSVDLRTYLGERSQLLFTGQYFQGSPTSKDRIEVGSDLFYVRRVFGYRGAEATLEGQFQLHPKVASIAGLDFIYDRETDPYGIRYLKYATGGYVAGDTLPVNISFAAHNLVNPAAYLQLRWTPNERLLRLTGGVRYDYHNIYGSQVSGRVAAVSSPSRNLHLKLLYGSAFQAPSPILLYANPLQAGDIIGNTNLRPQHVHTVEGQVIYQPTRALSLNSDVALNLLINKAEFTEQGINKTARNISKLRTITWEAGAELRLLDRLFGYFNGELVYAFRDVGQVGYVATLLGSKGNIYPPAIIRGGLRGQIPLLPLRAAVEALYALRRNSSDTNSLENGSVYSLPAYTMVNASLSTVGIKLMPGKGSTDISLSVRNILNAHAVDPGFSGIDYPLRTRTFFVELRQQL